MKTRLAGLALAVSLASPFATAQAVGTQTYDVCGGTYSSWSGFAFCASVQVAVTASSPGVWTVAMQIANLSGTNGSYAGSLFAQIGIDNILGGLANPANIVVTQDGSTLCTNTTNVQSNCWRVNEDQSAAGGINVDFLGQTSSGVNLSVASACSGANNYIYTCLSSKPVTISFDINQDFNPATSGNLYIKGQGALGSTECETGTTVPVAERCSTDFGTTDVTSTPEPATLGLVGMGLAGVAAKRRRRRKDETDEAIA